MGKTKYSLNDFDSSRLDPNAPVAASSSGDMPFTDRMTHMRSFVKALREEASAMRFCRVERRGHPISSREHKLREFGERILGPQNHG